MACQDCSYWTPGSVIPLTDPVLRATYGLCRPQFGLLPFWAARAERDMQTNTLPVEGSGCPGFQAIGPHARAARNLARAA
jgi:hypothetical protein